MAKIHNPITGLYTFNAVKGLGDVFYLLTEDKRNKEDRCTGGLVQ